MHLFLHTSSSPALSFYTIELCVCVCAVLFSLNYNHCVQHLQYSIGAALTSSYAIWNDAERFFFCECVVCLQ